MNIGEAAKQSGLPAKTIRYYEDIGLVLPKRDANGYRVFDPRDVHNLTFLARARTLGFTIEDCRALLALYQDSDRASADVKKIAGEHLAEINTKIAGLQAMADTLTTLVQNCAGNERPECPILSELEAPKPKLF